MLLSRAMTSPSLRRRAAFAIATRIASLAAAIVLAGSCGGGGMSPDAPPVDAIRITPNAATIVVGNATTLRADVLDAGGNAIGGRSVHWSIRDAAIATVGDDGTVTATAPGATLVSASSGGTSAVATITVTAEPVVSVRISPVEQRLHVGESGQFTATALDAAGNPLPGRAIAWSSADPSVASVSQSGQVTAVAPGAILVTATTEGKTATAAVTVSAIPVAAVTVTPPLDTIAVGQSTQLAATARDAGGGALAGRTVEWSSSSSAIATVSSTGLVTAIAVGSAAITATVEGRAAQSAIVVRPKPVSAVVVSPSATTVVVGETAQLISQVVDANGEPLAGRAIAYASADPAIATVSAAGAVTGVAAGATTITATSEGKQGTADVRVVPVPVAAVRVAPDPIRITIGQQILVTASALDAKGQTLTGRTVTWSSSAPAVVSIAGGIATGLTIGSAVIHATIDGIEGIVAATVDPVPSAQVIVSPATVTLAIGGSATLSAQVLDQSGQPINGRTVTWRSSDDAIALVTSSGVVTAMAAGTATVTATSGSASGQAAITVNAPTPPPPPPPPPPTTAASVTLSPSSANLVVGQTTQLGATARDANGVVLTNRPTTWTTSSGTVATVSSTGLVSAANPGSATITVTIDGISATSAITVTQVPVASVTITPLIATVKEGKDVQLTATLRDAAGNVLTGRTVAWQSSDTRVATVDNKGKVKGQHAGIAVISATAGGITGLAVVTVTK
jgi:uncharacterized protein YjdB